MKVPITGDRMLLHRNGMAIGTPQMVVSIWLGVAGLQDQAITALAIIELLACALTGRNCSICQAVPGTAADSAVASTAACLAAEDAADWLDMRL